MIEALVRRDRLLTLAGLGALTALAWAYLVLSPLHAHGSGATPPAAELRPEDGDEDLLP